MINHLKKYLGWYVLIPSIYLIFKGESEMWLVLLLCLLKMPPFDWVGRYENWLAKKMLPKAIKMKTWRDKQSKFIKIMLAIGVIILLILWFLYAPECELC
tara:strand:+ start:404 stop:703 length:300 start_codon:yes stop_codon:yes gene_type:complete